MSTEIDLATELAAVKAQLKEQTQQMAEMASMMKSMMSLAMPLLEEQTRKLRNEKEAEAARKKEEEEKAALEEKAKYAVWRMIHSDYLQSCMWELAGEYNRFQHRFAEQKVSKQKAAKKVEPAKPDFSSDWSCPDDGCAHNWVHAGKQYVRTFEGGVWEYDGECVGEWVGQWDPRTKTIDTTVSEPEFEE
jgi:hypothetical protein